MLRGHKVDRRCAPRFGAGPYEGSPAPNPRRRLEWQAAAAAVCAYQLDEIESLPEKEKTTSTAQLFSGRTPETSRS